MGMCFCPLCLSALLPNMVKRNVNCWGISHLLIFRRWLPTLLLLQLMLEESIAVLLLGTSIRTGQFRLLHSFVRIIFSWYAVYQVLYSPFEYSTVAGSVFTDQMCNWSLSSFCFASSNILLRTFCHGVTFGTVCQATSLLGMLVLYVCVYLGA